MVPAIQEQFAPPFSLLDSRGQTHHLADLLRHGPVVIVFFRGHWCPYCRRYLSKLQANHARFIEKGATLVAISPEPAATSVRLTEELNLHFPILCDATGEVMDRYQTRNRLTGTRTIMPHPSVFILDEVGAICFKSIDRNYKRRTTMHTIFSALAGFGP